MVHFFVLFCLMRLALSIVFPIRNHLDNFVIIHDKILNDAVPLVSTNVRSHLECAKLCTKLFWQCFGANVRQVDGRLLCEVFWVTLPDLSRLVDSVGDLYFNPGRRNYWTASETGLTYLSTTCAMCICREGGCEANIGLCQLRNGVFVCGPYRMTRPFYCDAFYTSPCDDTVEEDFEECAKNMTCSQQGFVNYMDRYDEICADGDTPTCFHYAIITYSGFGTCSSPPDDSLAFWDRVNLCCSNHGGC